MKKIPLGRLSAPDDTAYDVAQAADYLSGQAQDAELQVVCAPVSDGPSLPWAQYVAAEELDRGLRLGVDRVKRKSPFGA